MVEIMKDEGLDYFSVLCLGVMQVNLLFCQPGDLRGASHRYKVDGCALVTQLV